MNNPLGTDRLALAQCMSLNKQSIEAPSGHFVQEPQTSPSTAENQHVQFHVDEFLLLFQGTSASRLSGLG